MIQYQIGSTTHQGYLLSSEVDDDDASAELTEPVFA